MAINIREKVAIGGKLEYCDENMTDLLTGAETKWSFTWQKKSNINLEQLLGIVRALHATYFPQCFLKSGGREGAIIIPMYYLKSCASQDVD